MANNLVIVAIPAEDEYVRRISSEKVPHMTLLYLGEGVARPNAQRIADFLEHAAKTSLTRFGLDVDHRGTLGEDKADVLFFGNDYGGAQDIIDFRSVLLKDPTIRQAYDSVTQYPEWTPHLTLGYPATPAKPDERDYPGTHWVSFDRVALWTGDYDGPEFELGRMSDMALPAYHTARGESFLAHYGVKGMKWGVRRSPQELSADAERANTAKTKARASGLGSLSNQELKDLTSRLNLETQVASLSQKNSKVTRGRTTVAGILAVGTTINSVIAFSKSPAGQAIRKSLG